MSDPVAALSPEELEALGREHYKFHDSERCRCMETWPCSTARLLATVAEMQKRETPGCEDCDESCACWSDAGWQRGEPDRHDWWICGRCHTQKISSLKSMVEVQDAEIAELEQFRRLAPRVLLQEKQIATKDAILRECAKTFREYERVHREGVVCAVYLNINSGWCGTCGRIGDAHQDDIECQQQAEANAALAAKCEAAIGEKASGNVADKTTAIIETLRDAVIAAAHLLHEYMHLEEAAKLAQVAKLASEFLERGSR